MSTPTPDLTLLYTRPTSRPTSAADRVDLILPAPNNTEIIIATYVKIDHANAIIAAINELDMLQDILADLIDDLIIDQPSTPALTAARTYLSTHRP